MRKLATLTIAFVLIMATLGSKSAAMQQVGCVPPPSGMVSWWPGDGSANDLIDSNHGTMMNGATFTSGMVGQAFSFDGTNDYVAIPNGIIPSTQRYFTLDTWVYPNNTNQMAIFYAGASMGEYMMEIAAGNFRFGVKLADGNWYRATFGASSGRWVHLAGVRRNNTIELWVDGILRQTTNVPTLNLYITSGYNSSIGAYNRGAGYWNGLIDEVELFTRDLSQTEVQSIYNAGAAGKCKPQQILVVKKQSRYSLAPLASTNIAKADSLLTQVDSLLSDAKAKSLDTAACEKIIDEAKADLVEAKLRLTSPTTANYFALRAAAKLKAALDCLKALTG